MAVVALTGGIGAGKSTVAHELTAAGITVIDADQVAREVVSPGQPALAAIAQRFGRSVLTPQGELDRAALAQRVFGDDQARMDLNSLVHPAVWERSTKLFRDHHRDHPEIPVVYAVPLLAEGSRADEFDLVVVVDAPASIRHDRLVGNRNMDSEAATARINAQASDDERLRIADVVLDAGGELEQTQQAARQLAEGLWTHWPDRLHAIAHELPTPGE
jgi:dephospho-CoA kinase